MEFLTALIPACTACAASRNGDAWNIFVTGASVLISFVFVAAAVLFFIFRQTSQKTVD